MRILLISFILMTGLVNSQNYKPLLTDLNEWHLTTCFYGCITDMYRTSGDTIYDGKSYKVLDGFHYISRTFLLRENVEEKKIYLRITNYASEEYLLYDFSMRVGDSIDIKNPITPFPDEGGFYKLDSIVSKPLVNNEPYRFYYLSPTPGNTISDHPAVWIEGIGSMSMITAPGGDPDLYGAGLLSCALKDGELVYSDYDVVEDCSSKILNTPNLYFSRLQFIQEKKNSFYLNNAEDVLLVEVFNMNGQKIFTLKNSEKNRLEIDLEAFSSGVYLVHAFSSSGERKVFRAIKN